MEADRLRFGVIGCASIARQSFLPALMKSVSADLVAVASRSRKKAKSFSSLFNCEAVHGYDNLLTRKDIDAVYIATPIGIHAEWSIASAQAGKHVLCEKTLATNVDETQLILETCEKYGVAVFEAFAYQFHPQHAAVRKIVEQGQIGETVLFQAWFGFPPINSNHRYDPVLGGGALLDAGAYTVHAARHFYNREPVRIQASLDYGEKLVDIHGSVLLDFGNRQTAFLAFGFDNMYRNSYSIWGTKGMVTLTRAFSIPPILSPTIILEQQSYREERILPTYDQFLGEIEIFSSGYNDSDKCRRWREDSLGQAQTLEAIRQSAMLLR
jgi:predicted dehydrogenase